MGSRSSQRGTDQIDWLMKGRGLIMLFHGPPGVGKTSTAECLAVYSRRPLLAITAADLGTTPNDVERCLETFFSLAQRWDCIILFDEADILVQARDRSDFTRNAIVSVTLRCLEYYSGILIMTTARVGTLDEAIKSRMHVVLLFPALDKASSMMIWDMSLRRVQQQRVLSKVHKADIMRLVEQSWDDYHSRFNGRDIHNAVQSAVALAKADYKDYEEPYFELTPKHVEIVLKMLNEFDKYTTAVHDSRQAKIAGDRADDFRVAPQYVHGALPRPLYTTSRVRGAIDDDGSD